MLDFEIRHHTFGILIEQTSLSSADRCQQSAPNFSICFVPRKRVWECVHCTLIFNVCRVVAVFIPKLSAGVPKQWCSPPSSRLSRCVSHAVMSQLRAMCICRRSHLEYLIPFIWFPFAVFIRKSFSPDITIDTYFYIPIAIVYVIVVGVVVIVYHFRVRYWPVWDFNLCSLIIPVDDPCAVDYWTYSLVPYGLNTH